MATTLTGAETTEVESVTVSFPISKMEKDEDGDLIVKGVATDGTVDSDYQIVDPEWSAKALKDWLESGGNVRMAHDAHRPVGKGLSVELDRDGDGKHWVKSLIVDAEAKRLVEKGVLRAYSVGISHPVIKRDPTGKARGGIICGGELSELSIVDRPANKNSYLELAKAAGANGAIEFTGILHEGASEETVEKASGTFSPSDLAKLLEHRRVAEKRDMDPAVGGGVDRDKIPASDFVDSDGRRFPIVTPGDVSDAVSSYGRAKPQIPMDRFQARLKAIAHRKGPSFVAELPESWSDGDATKALQAAPPATPNQQPGHVPTPPAHSAAPAGPPAGAAPAAPQHQAAPPAGPQHQAPPAAGPQDMAQPHQQQPQVMKDHCGMQLSGDYHFCPACGSSLDGGQEGEDKGMAQAQPPADPTDNQGQMHVSMPMDGAQKADSPPSKSVGEPEETDEVDSVAEAKKKPKKNKPSSLDPETEAYATKPDTNEKVPTPKEAPAVDGLPSSKKSADYAMETAMVLKQLDVPSDLGALHDLICPGFHPADAEKCHPGHSLKSLDVAHWQNEALNAASGAPLDVAAAATERWQAAESIKSMANVDPQGLTEERLELHKAFKDAQVGPGTAPVPTQIRAGQFKRPYLSDGHARRSMQAEGPNTHEVPTGSISASDFTRGYLDSGHSDDSPSNKSSDQRPISYPSVTGQLKTVDYATAGRNAAKSAMLAMHDHLAQTFPDLCPMAGHTEAQGYLPSGDTTVPQPVGERASKSEAPVEQVEATAIEKAAAAGVGPDLVAVLQGFKDEFAAELRTVTKALKKERKRNDELQATIDSMASMPDPTVAAFKGVALTHPVNKSAVGARTIAETAERTQMMMMQELETQFRTSPDPAQREAAWSTLMKMRGLA